nr:COX15/CtaA family protein [Echinimonas agarilytica]
MKAFVWFSIVLALGVILLGAYTRLTDAGLGCPDWPGCYGTISVPDTQQAIERANQAFPERQVEPQKAWNEMIHRYFAGALGVFIAVIAVMGFKRPKAIRLLSSSLLVLVIFQALLGMWTVTLKLMPLVVMGHLLGGFSIFVLLCVLATRLQARESSDITRVKGRWCLIVAAFVVFVQISLGGWTSANYAATACTQFPICEGDWQQKLDFAGGFSLPKSDDGNYEYGRHSYAERMTIHIVHRAGAVVATLFVILAAFSLFRQGWLSSASWLLSLIVVQVGLGITNVVASLPLSVAVAHNGVALMLLASLVVFWVRTAPQTIFGDSQYG